MKTSRQSSSFLAELIDFFNAVQSWGLKRIHAAGWIAVVLLFAGGIISWASFNYVLEETNTEAFCISCHEMHDKPYKEYIEKPHYKNASGVRATCADWSASPDTRVIELATSSTDFPAV